MDSYGKSRAASLMDAARRRLFVSRIEKYEAKVRHAKALMNQQKEAALPFEERRAVSSSEEQQFAIDEVVLEQRQPVLDSEDQQPRSVSDKLMLPLPSEKNLVLEQVSFELNIPAEHHQELPPKGNDRECPHTDKHCHSQKDCLGGKGLVSQDEGFQQHYGVESLQQRMCLQQKEMISGRSALPHMKTIVKDFDALDIVSPSAEKLPMEGMIPLDQQVNMYSDFKLPLTSDVNMQVLATALKVRIKAADMSASMQEHAFRSARECLDTVGKLQSKRIAYTLKKEFDKVYGPAWHCIVGTSFGSYVTHSLGGFVYFSLEKVSVLLFKTTVEPIVNP